MYKHRYIYDSAPELLPIELMGNRPQIRMGGGFGFLSLSGPPTKREK